jgi:hypothetical protein
MTANDLANKIHDRMVIIIVHDTSGCLVSISFHSSHSPAIVSGEFRLEIADAIDTSMVVNSCYRLSHAEQVERLLVSRRSEPCFVLLRARAIRLVSAQNKRLRQIQSQPLLGRKGPPPNGNSSSKNAVERNSFPLGETKKFSEQLFLHVVVDP